MPDGERTLEVLVVEDDADIRSLLETAIVRAGYTAVAVPDGSSALAYLAATAPALVVLDLGLPDMDGLELLRTVRDRFDAPTIVLTGRDSESERIAGLDIGADDYVTKPFSPRELMSRIGAVLRRSSPHADAPMSFGSLVIDPVKREALLHGEEVALTRREFDLLLHFAQHPNQAFSKGELLEEVWQSNIDWQDADTVTEHVRRVRRKVDDPGSPSRIVTLRGIGYRFEP